MRNPLCFFLFGTLSLALFLILGPVVRDGMFVDGLVYTNIAKNLSDGIGSLWSPMVSKYAGVFYDQPPLLPFVESLFFRMLGDGKYTEDVYNSVVFATVILLIYLIWSQLVGRAGRRLAILPILFLLLGQEVQLRYPNAMLECGMTAILLITTWAYFTIFRAGRLLIAAAVVGLGVVLAVLAKGPAGLFLLALPVVHQFALTKRLSIPALLVPVAVLLSLGYLLFLMVPASFEFMTAYFDQQVMAALWGERTENIATHRLRFVELLVMANLPAILTGGLIRMVPASRPSRFSAVGWVFVTIGALAVLPLVISTKQAAYYQLPALPYLAIGYGLLLANRFATVLSWLTSRPRLTGILNIIGGLSVLAGIVFVLTRIGTTDRRDVQHLEDAAAISRAIGIYDPKIDGYAVQITGPERWRGEKRLYSLNGFLTRFHDLHVAPSQNRPITIFIKTGPEEVSTGAVLLENERLAVVAKP